MLPARIHCHIITGLSLRANQSGDQRAALWELTRRMTRQTQDDHSRTGCGTPLTRDTLDRRPTRRAD